MTDKKKQFQKSSINSAQIIEDKQISKFSEQDKESAKSKNFFESCKQKTAISKTVSQNEAAN